MDKQQEDDSIPVWCVLPACQPYVLWWLPLGVSTRSGLISEVPCWGCGGGGKRVIHTLWYTCPLWHNCPLIYSHHLEYPPPCFGIPTRWIEGTWDKAYPPLPLWTGTRLWKHYLKCSECTRTRSQSDRCIQSKSTWLMFMHPKICLQTKNFPKISVFFSGNTPKHHHYQKISISMIIVQKFWKLRKNTCLRPQCSNLIGSEFLYIPPTAALL